MRKIGMKLRRKTYGPPDGAGGCDVRPCEVEGLETDVLWEGVGMLFVDSMESIAKKAA
jgi:hypothetical protein